jgi:hypothetical protein
MARITLTKLPLEILKMIFLQLFYLDTVNMSAIVDFASTCRQLRSSRPPANAGHVVAGNVESVVLGSRIYSFCRARVQSVSLLVKSMFAFEQLEHVVFMDRLTLETADILKHMPFSARIKNLSVNLDVLLGSNVVDLDFLATYTRLTHLKITGGGLLSDISALLNCKLHMITIFNSSLKDLSLLSKLTTLKMVALLRCNNVTDISSLRHLSALEWLSIDYCRRITDISCLVECKRLSFCEITRFAGTVPQLLYNKINDFNVYDADLNPIPHDADFNHIPHDV